MRIQGAGIWGQPGPAAMFRLALTRVCSPAKPLPLLGLRFPLCRSMGRKRGGPQDPLRLSYAQVPQSDGADTCTVLKDELGTLSVMGTEPRGIPWTRGSGCACRPRPCTCWTRTGEQAGLCSPEQTPGARGHAGPAGGPRLALFRPLQDGVYGAGAVNTTSVLRPGCPSPQWPRPSARSKFCIRPKQVPLLAERSPRPPVPLFSAGHPTEASEGQRRTRLTPSSRCGRAEEGASRRGGRDSWGKARSPGSHRSRRGALGLNRGLPASSVRVPGSRRNYRALRFWRREVRNRESAGALGDVACCLFRPLGRQHAWGCGHIALASAWVFAWLPPLSVSPPPHLTGTCVTGLSGDPHLRTFCCISKDSIYK